MTNSQIAQIEKLRKLLQQGAINDSEFETRRAIILGEKVAPTQDRQDLRNEKEIKPTPAGCMVLLVALAGAERLVLYCITFNYHTTIV